MSKLDILHISKRFMDLERKDSFLKSVMWYLTLIGMIGTILYFLVLMGLVTIRNAFGGDIIWACLSFPIMILFVIYVILKRSYFGLLTASLLLLLFSAWIVIITENMLPLLNISKPWYLFCTMLYWMFFVLPVLISFSVGFANAVYFPVFEKLKN